MQTGLGMDVTNTDLEILLRMNDLAKAQLRWIQAERVIRELRAEMAAKEREFADHDCPVFGVTRTQTSTGGIG